MEFLKQNNVKTYAKLKILSIDTKEKGNIKIQNDLIPKSEIKKEYTEEIKDERGPKTFEVADIPIKNQIHEIFMAKVEIKSEIGKETEIDICSAKIAPSVSMVSDHISPEVNNFLKKINLVHK